MREENAVTSTQYTTDYEQRGRQFWRLIAPPRLTLYRGGVHILNVAAVRALGRPVRVRFSINAARRTVRVVPAEGAGQKLTPVGPSDCRSVGAHSLVADLGLAPDRLPARIDLTERDGGLEGAL